MNIAETLKHFGNHWELYCLAGDGEYIFDKAKKYLMDECGKPESTARAKMSAFRYARDSLIKISSDGKRYFIDLEKLNIIEVSIDSVIHFSKIDYRGQEMEELEVLYDFQKGETSDWMDKYYQLKELSQKQEAGAYKENLELRDRSVKTIAGISEKVMALANNCDKRLQQLEQRDFMAKGLSFIERVKIFFQMKLGLIPIKEYRSWRLKSFESRMG